MSGTAGCGRRRGLGTVAASPAGPTFTWHDLLLLLFLTCLSYHPFPSLAPSESGSPLIALLPRREKEEGSSEFNDQLEKVLEVEVGKAHGPRPTEAGPERTKSLEGSKVFRKEDFLFHSKYVRKSRKAKRTTAHGATLMSNISTNMSAMAQEADERERTQVTTTRKVRNKPK